MIDPYKLTEEDIGKKVCYESPHGDKIELGVISSWNNEYIFVKYHWRQLPNPGPRVCASGEATSPLDLTWL